MMEWLATFGLAAGLVIVMLVGAAVLLGGLAAAIIFALRRPPAPLIESAPPESYCEGCDTIRTGSAMVFDSAGRYRCRQCLVRDAAEAS